VAVARRSNKLGLALGGGAARGLAHIGVIEVLEKNGVAIDLVAGTSIGAIIGAFYAAGHNGAEMRRIADELSLRVLFPLEDMRLTSGASRGQAVEAWLRERLPPSFADLQKPFACVSVDLSTGQRVVHDSGDLPNAVRASISLPLVFVPVVCADGSLLVDGGLVEPVPVRLAREMGARRVIAVAVSNLSPRSLSPRSRRSLPVLARRSAACASQGGGKSRPPSMREVAMASLDVVRCEIAAAQMKEADVLITPDVACYGGHAFSESAAMIEIGRAATLEAMPAVKEMLKSRLWSLR
jgi:NTE family protein